MLLERRVEQMPYDLRKCEADRGGNHETDRRNNQSPAKWPQPRRNSAEGFRRAQLALTFGAVG